MSRWFRRRQPDWKALDRMKLALVEEFRDAGVTDVELITGSVPPFASHAVLVVGSDSERDHLLHGMEPLYPVPELFDQAVEALSPNSLDAELLDGVTAQSQETVERDYEGSWFYALR